VIPCGWLVALGKEYSVNVPDVVTAPILFPDFSVNHKRPSGPATISSGLLFAVGIVYSVMLPDVVALAILLVLYSVNQIRPSGPKVAVIPWGLLLPLSPYSV